MREALLRELEDEYCLLRNANEREENNRRNRIRKELPDLERLLRVREDLVFGTLKVLGDDHVLAQSQAPQWTENIQSQRPSRRIRNGPQPPRSHGGERHALCSGRQQGRHPA